MPYLLPISGWYVRAMLRQVLGAGFMQQRVDFDIGLRFLHQRRHFALAFIAADLVHLHLETLLDFSLGVFPFTSDQISAQAFDVLQTGVVEDVVLSHVLLRFFDDLFDFLGALVRQFLRDRILFTQAFDYDSFQFLLRICFADLLPA